MNGSNADAGQLYSCGFVAAPIFVVLYSFSLTRDFISSLVFSSSDFYRVFDVGKGIYEHRYGAEANMSLFTFSSFALHFLLLEFVAVTILSTVRMHMVPSSFFGRRETGMFIGCVLLSVFVLCLQPAYSCDVVLRGCFFGYTPWFILISFAFVGVILMPSLSGAVISSAKIFFTIEND